MNKDKNKKTIIVLGNGASIGSNRYPIRSSLEQSMLKMPSAQNFFYDLFHIDETDYRQEKFVNFLGLTYEQVHDLLVRAWGLTKNIKSFNVREWRNINIEDIFTFLDLGEKMYNKGTCYYIAFSKAKELLEDFIWITLWHRCKEQHCEHLLNIFYKLKPNDDIISFNWDTIADYTLERAQNIQYKNYLKLMADNKPSIRKYTKPGLFLKLHGSLNWIVCQNKKCKYYENPRIPFSKNIKGFPRLHSGNYDKCPTCKRKRSKSFIIPPVSNKLIYKNTFLHKLWLIAREKLSYANRIVFIGYSFPVTDFYSEWLFRQIYFLIGGRFAITVVNPEMFKKGSVVPKRYKAIFKHCKITKYRTLADYAKKIRYANEI